MSTDDIPANNNRSQGYTMLTAEQHGLQQHQFSASVLKVCATLHKNNFDAYVVGGAVRDLLLGIQPKDFDVATNATPEQVSRLFKRARVIGRRFKIAHVYLDADLIEVTTFRSAPDAAKLQQAQKASGLLLSDNQYGTLEEDAQRRDFTINALYYAPHNECVYDYCQGLDAVAAKSLKVIGDPEQRFREDPVRMLRAVRLQAKLPLEIEAQTAALIRQHCNLLHQVSSARLFDELLKLFMNGHAESSFDSLHTFSLLGEVLPCVTRHFPEQAVASKLYRLALRNSDQRIAQGKGITPAFFLAVFLWPEVQRKLVALQQKGVAGAEQELWLQAMFSTLDEQQLVTSIPKRFQVMMREIWQMQPRLLRHSKPGKRAKRLLAHPRFRAAYDFLLLREQAGELEPGCGQWWQQYQQEHAEILEHTQRERSQQFKSKNRPRKRR